MRKEAGYVKVSGKSIQELVSLPVGKLFEVFSSLELNETDARVAERLIKEITVRVKVPDVMLACLISPSTGFPQHYPVVNHRE